MFGEFLQGITTQSPELAQVTHIRDCPLHKAFSKESRVAKSLGSVAEKIPKESGKL